jgi:hypothetical protein
MGRENFLRVCDRAGGSRHARQRVVGQSSGNPSEQRWRHEGFIALQIHNDLVLRSPGLPNDLRKPIGPGRVIRSGEQYLERRASHCGGGQIGRQCALWILYCAVHGIAYGLVIGCDDHPAGP